MRGLDILTFLALLLGCLMTPEAWSYDPQAQSRVHNERPEELKGLGIKEQLGGQVPLDLVFQNESGDQVQLKNFTSDGKPIVLSLVYYTCPSLCNIHLNGLMEGVENLKFKPGKDFELVFVSFEPSDTPETARAKKQTYVETYGLEEYSHGIHFLLGEEDSIKALTEVVGFSYGWDESSDQWAHASAAMFLTPAGKISRYLHGVVFDDRNLRLAISEASDGKVGGFIDQVMLFCFNYDPEGNEYALAAFKVMRLGGAVMVFLLALWLVPFWWAWRRKNSVQGVS